MYSGLFALPAVTEIKQKNFYNLLPSASGVNGINTCTGVDAFKRASSNGLQEKNCFQNKSKFITEDYFYTTHEHYN